MKEKIFQALKLAYSNLGLSDEILQGQADALSASGLVTDDNLATVVQGQKAFLTSLQSGIDKRVTDAVNKAKEKEAASGGEQNKQQPENEEPEWFKKYKAEQEQRYSGIKQNIVTAGLETKDSAFPLSTPAEKGKEMARQWAEGLPDAN